MATPADVSGLENEISNLQTQAGNVQDQLNMSPTALGGEGAPTSFDISNQTELDRIQKQITKLTDEKLRAQWYPPSQQTTPAAISGENPPSQGYIGTALDWINRPLYGIVGAIKHFTGQGTGSFQQDIADNMVRNKNTMGGLLKTTGMPWAVSAPLGFALDISLNPVNWITMGEGALIPKIGLGAFKGATETGDILGGIASAAKSGVLEKATTIGSYTPYFKDTESFANLAKKSIEATKAFEDITGNTVQNIVETQRGMGIGSWRIGLEDLFNRVAEKVPGGQTFIKNFYSSPHGWMEDARMKDIIQTVANEQKEDVSGIAKAVAKGEPASLLEPTIQEAGKIVSTPSGLPLDIDMDAKDVSNLVPKKDVDAAMLKLDSLGLKQKMENAAPIIANTVGDAAEIGTNSTIYVTPDPIEIQNRMLQIAQERLQDPGLTMDDLKRVMEGGVFDKTEVAAYDNFMQKIKNLGSDIDANGKRIAGIGEETLDSYNKAIGTFKLWKVGAAPTAWTNFIVGDTSMVHMLGALNASFLKWLGRSGKMYMNVTDQAAFLDGLLMRAGKTYYQDARFFGKYYAEHPTPALGMFGSTAWVGASDRANTILQGLKDAGEIKATETLDSLSPQLQEVVKQAAQIDLGAGTQKIRDLIAEGKNLSPQDLGTEFVGQEAFNSSGMRKMLNNIAKGAADKTNPLNPVYKILNFTLNTLPSGYSKGHQAFKFATVMQAMVDGYSKDELRMLARFVNINSEDLMPITTELETGKQLAQVRYILHPRAAEDVANAMFINYAAMPAAIKVLRGMPLLGSPFASFSYAMAMKTGQTLAYNPAAFSKVALALKDFGGTQTPFEKKALTGPIYQHLTQAGMYRVPFFDQYPLYIDLARMIPFYSLNMFNPPGTNYVGGTPGEALTQAIQSSPFIKDPVGSLMFDYIIQPLILRDGIRPQGQFGQALYPIGATPTQQSLYALRTLGEAFTPGVAAYGGLVTPESLANLAPGYRWRELAYAKAGKNQFGITGKESVPSRTIRAILSTTGIPVQAPVDLTFQPRAQENP